ncbi:MAG: hypothetical protein HRU29_08345 [Rhizobiales bacterium]|nr:hypothetical protein [Hyphomicrobiales bacterium]NRB14396.1 hypothetical protein [Hyphomicrobiales bacterium]
MKLSVILFVNACFSLLNAALFLISSRFFADLILVRGYNVLGFYGTEIIQLLAIGLLIFGLYTALIAFKIDKLIWHTRIIIMMDWSWVLATLALFIAVDVFSFKGMVYFGVVGAIVSAFAITQATQYRAAIAQNQAD